MSITWMTLKVVRKVPEAENVVSLELADPTGKELPAFTAGAHVDVEIRPGLIRQYSLYGDPEERRRYRVAVLRTETSRGGSVTVHQSLRQGDTVRVSVPRNHFPLSDGEHPSVLLAGGIGITPLYGMARALNRRGADFELHYCARSEARCAFLGALQDADYADRVRFYLTGQSPDYRLDLDSVMSNAAPNAHFYVCGPARFIDQVLETGRRHGIDEERLHREFFAPPEPAADADPDGAFQVRLERSGRTLAVPADKTIAETLKDNGVDVELSCEQGVCGTCLTALLEGEADHRDFYQTEAEQAANEQIALCCSRARSPLLVLDL